MRNRLYSALLPLLATSTLFPAGSTKTFDPPSKTSKKILTNSDILEFYRKKTDERIIWKAIQENYSDFDLSDNGIKILKRNKVSSSTIMRMISWNKVNTPETTPSDTDIQREKEKSDKAAIEKMINTPGGTYFGLIPGQHTIDQAVKILQNSDAKFNLINKDGDPRFPVIEVLYYNQLDTIEPGGIAVLYFTEKKILYKIFIQWPGELWPTSTRTKINGLLSDKYEHHGLGYNGDFSDRNVIEIEVSHKGTALGSWVISGGRTAKVEKVVSLTYTHVPILSHVIEPLQKAIKEELRRKYANADKSGI